MEERNENLEDLMELIVLLNNHLKVIGIQDTIIDDILFNMYLLVTIEEAKNDSTKD